MIQTYQKFWNPSSRSAEQTAAAAACNPLGQLTVRVKSTKGYSDSVLLPGPLPSPLLTGSTLLKLLKQKVCSFTQWSVSWSVEIPDCPLHSATVFIPGPWLTSTTLDWKSCWSQGGRGPGPARNRTCCSCSPRLRDSGFLFFRDLLNFLSDKLVIELVVTGSISKYNYPISRTGLAIWNSRSVPCGPAVS